MAIKDFRESINLLQNELLNAVIQNLTIAPLNPKNGQIFYGTAGGYENKLLLWSGEWIDLTRRVKDGDKGDITVSNDVALWEINPNKVSYDKIQKALGNNVLLGNISGTDNDFSEITSTQLTAILDVFTGTLQGLVPASGGDPGYVLNADGLWRDLNEISPQLYDNWYATKAEIDLIDPATVLGETVWAFDTKSAYLAVYNEAGEVNTWQETTVQFDEVMNSFKLPATAEDLYEHLIGQSIFYNARNDSGTLGTVLSSEPKIFLAVGAIPTEVSWESTILASAQDIADGDKYGLNVSNVAPDQKFKCITYGRLTNVNTQAWPVNTKLYAHPTINGELTDIRPESNARLIAVVKKQDLNEGILFVNTVANLKLDRDSVLFRLNRIEFTGQEIVTASGTFFEALIDDKGNVASASRLISVPDNSTLPCPQDHISQIYTTDTTFFSGTKEATLSYSISTLTANEQFFLEIYIADSDGVVVTSTSGLPNGDLGVAPMAVLNSSVINTTVVGTEFDVNLEGSAPVNVTIPTGHRMLFHILVRKEGVLGPNKNFTLYFGTDHNAYATGSLKLTTDDVDNASGVPGVTATEALNTLNTQLISTESRLTVAESDIDDNTAAISIIDGRVTQNESDIVILYSDTSTNTANIATNTADIATNVGDIADNTLLANDKTRWFYPYIPGTYPKNWMTREGGWTMVTNKETSDYPSPQLGGVTGHLYSGVLSDTSVVAKQLIVGQRYTAGVDVGAFLTGYRIYGIAGLTYYIYAVRNASVGAVEFLLQFNPVNTGWREIAYTPTLISAGATFDVIALLKGEDATPISTSTNYDYRKPKDVVVPSTGEIVHAESDVKHVHVHYTDNDGVDRQSMLAGLGIGDELLIDTILILTIQSSVDNGTYYTFEVLPELRYSRQQVLPVVFTSYSTAVIDYSVDPGYWGAGTLGVQGIYSQDGSYIDADLNTDQYIIDLILTEAVISEDWDIVSMDGDAGAAGGDTGAGVPEAPIDGNEYARGNGAWIIADHKDTYVDSVEFDVNAGNLTLNRAGDITVPLVKNIDGRYVVEADLVQPIAKIAYTNITNEFMAAQTIIEGTDQTSYGGKSITFLNDGTSSIVQDGGNSHPILFQTRDSAGTINTALSVGGSDSQVSLNFSGDTKLATVADGVILTGNMTMSGNAIIRNASGTLDIRVAAGIAVTGDIVSNSDITATYFRGSGLFLTDIPSGALPANVAYTDINNHFSQSQQIEQGDNSDQNWAYTGLGVKNAGYTGQLYLGQVLDSYGYIGSSHYYNSGQFRTDGTRSSVIKFASSNIGFYTDSDIIPDVDFVPTERMRLSSTGLSVYVPQTIIKSTASDAFVINTIAGGIGDTIDIKLSNTSVFKVQTGGNVYATDGVGGLPAYSFISDSNSGMYSESADVIGFSTGALNRVAISSLGIDVRSGGYLINGIDINTSGTLSNVAYKDRDNNFTSQQTIKGDETTGAAKIQELDYAIGKSGIATNWVGTSLDLGYTHTPGSTEVLITDLVPQNGWYYYLEVTITGRTTERIQHITVGGITYSYMSGNQSYKIGGRAVNSDPLTIQPQGNWDGTVTVKFQRVLESAPLLRLNTNDGSSAYEFRRTSQAFLLGSKAGKYLIDTVGNNSFYVGNFTGENVVTSTYNFGVGNNVLTENSYGNYIIASGYNVLSKSKFPNGNRYIVAYGGNIGNENMTGNNHFFGWNLGLNITTGSASMLFGSHAGSALTTGNRNIIFGNYSMRVNATGDDNTLFGSYSLSNITRGDSNIAVGYGAGRYSISNGDLVESDDSIFIGFDTKSLNSISNREIVIGYKGEGHGSDTVTIGTTDTTDNYFFGNIHVETTPTLNNHLANKLYVDTALGDPANLPGNVAYTNVENNWDVVQTFYAPTTYVTNFKGANSTVITIGDTALTGQQNTLYRNTNGACWVGLRSDGASHITGTSGSNVLYLGVGGSDTAEVKTTGLDVYGKYFLGGSDINTAGTLDNVAYLDQANVFSKLQTITAQTTDLGSGFHANLFLDGANGYTDYSLSNKMVISTNVGYNSGRYTGGIHFTRRAMTQQGPSGSGIRGVGQDSELSSNALELYISNSGEQNKTAVYIDNTGDVVINETLDIRTLPENTESNLALVTGTVYGPELITNGGFDTDTDWTKNANTTIAGGVASFNDTVFTSMLSPATPTPDLIAGKTYSIKTTNVIWVAGGLRAQIGGSTLTLQAGTHEIIYTAVSTQGFLYFVGTGLGFTGSIDSISIQEVLTTTQVQTRELGSLAFEDITGYVPYVGADQNLNLGANKLLIGTSSTAHTLNINGSAQLEAGNIFFTNYWGLNWGANASINGESGGSLYLRTMGLERYKITSTGDHDFKSGNITTAGRGYFSDGVGILDSSGIYFSDGSRSHSIWNNPYGLTLSHSYFSGYDLVVAKSSGNILINTSNDNSIDRLQVQGSGLFRGILKAEELEINSFTISGGESVDTILQENTDHLQIRNHGLGKQIYISYQTTSELHETGININGANRNVKLYSRNEVRLQTTTTGIDVLGSSIKLNGVDINAGGLTNVAYLNQSNIFTENQTIVDNEVNVQYDNTQVQLKDRIGIRNKVVTGANAGTSVGFFDSLWQPKGSLGALFFDDSMDYMYLGVSWNDTTIKIYPDTHTTDFTGTVKIDNVDINAGGLSNVAYLDQVNVFTASQSLDSDSATGKRLTFNSVYNNLPVESYLYNINQVASWIIKYDGVTTGVKLFSRIFAPTAGANTTDVGGINQEFRHGRFKSNVYAAKFIAEEKTNDDILLGDGTTTSLSVLHSGYVPYTGAASNVDLGLNWLTSGRLISNSKVVANTHIISGVEFGNSVEIVHTGSHGYVSNARAGNFYIRQQEATGSMNFQVDSSDKYVISPDGNHDFKSGDITTLGSVDATGYNLPSAGNKLWERNFLLDVYGGSGTTISYWNGTAQEDGLKVTYDNGVEIRKNLSVGEVPYNNTSITALVADEVLGDELVVNGSFDTAGIITPWTENRVGLQITTVSGGVCTIDSNGVGDCGIIQNVGLVSGKTYILRFNVQFISDYVAKKLTIYTGDFIDLVDIVDGIQEVTFVGVNPSFTIRGTGAYTGYDSVFSLDNVSVREVISSTSEVQKRVLGDLAFENSSDVLGNVAYTNVANSFVSGQVFNATFDADRKAIEIYNNIPNSNRAAGASVIKLNPTPGNWTNSYTFFTGGTSGGYTTYPSFGVRHTFGSIQSSTVTEVDTDFTHAATSPGLPLSAIRIKGQSGDIGIGVLEPTEKLDINGWVNSLSGYKINGTDINDGVLSNVAYLDQVNTFTNRQTIINERSGGEILRVHNTSAGGDTLELGNSSNNGFRYLIRGENSEGRVFSLASNGDIITAGYSLSQSFIKKDGLSTQFLKADGSVDANTYSTYRGSIGSSDDWNTYIETGIYKVNSVSGPNAPIAYAFGYLIVEAAESGDYAVQIYYADVSSGETFRRTQWGGGWRAWKELYTSGSFQGGVDYVVSESDTLQSVTDRGNSTTNGIELGGRLTVNQPADWDGLLMYGYGTQVSDYLKIHIGPTPMVRYQSSGTLQHRFYIGASSYFRINTNGIHVEGTIYSEGSVTTAGAITINYGTTGATTALNVGGSGNANLKVRHIEGKEHNTTASGELNLNHYNSANVNVGLGGGDLVIYNNARTSTSPTQDTHLTNKLYVDNLLDGELSGYLRNTTDTFTGDLTIDEGYLITTGSTGIKTLGGWLHLNRYAASNQHVSIGNNATDQTNLYIPKGVIGVGTSTPETNVEVYSIETSEPAIPGDVTTGMFSLNHSEQATLSIGVNSSNAYWISNVNRAFSGAHYYDILLNPLGGNVGVGVTSPVTALHIDGILQVQGGGSNTFYGTDVNGSYARVFGGQTYGFRDIGGRQLINFSLDDGSISALGKLSVGTTGISEALYVVGKGRFNNGGDLYIDAAPLYTVLASTGSTRAFRIEVNSATRYEISSNGNHDFRTGDITTLGNILLGSGQRLTGSSTYLDVKNSSAGAGGLRLRDSNNDIKGWLYHSDQDFGLLNSGGSWKVKVNTDVHLFYGTSLKLATTAEGVSVAGSVYSNLGDSFISAHTGRGYFGNATGNYIQVGKDEVGQSGVFGSASSRGGSLGPNYRSYWAYDSYFDQHTEQWFANRTTLPNKQQLEMGYHTGMLKYRVYGGDVTTGWLDEDWTDVLSVDRFGNVNASGAVTARDTYNFSFYGGQIRNNIQHYIHFYDNGGNFAYGQFKGLAIGSLYKGDVTSNDLYVQGNATAAAFIGDSVQIGELKTAYQENTDVDSAATEVIATVPTTYDAVFFDYVVKNGTNLRAGTLIVAHDGTSVVYTDNSTSDLGDTSGVVLSADISGSDIRLLADTVTDNWIIKTSVRSI